jgi:hypothetical protein
LELLAILSEEEVNVGKPGLQNRSDPVMQSAPSIPSSGIKIRAKTNITMHMRPLHIKSTAPDSTLSPSVTHLTPPKANTSMYYGSHPNLSLSTLAPSQNVIHLLHMGKNGGTYTLFASSMADRKLWMNKIENQLEQVTQKQKAFKIRRMSSSFFSTVGNRVNSEVILRKSCFFCRNPSHMIYNS